MSKYEKYTLAVGEAGAERLRVLNLVFNPFTLTVLDEHADLSGKQVLDLGCGTGIMATELAKRVGEKGCVVAVDISSEQLKIAKKNAEKAQLNNIQFVELAADNISTLNQCFDFIYCRFVLAHLVNPELVIEMMINLLNKNGKIFLEEPVSYEVIYSDPPVDCVEQYRQICLQQKAIYNTDMFIGKRLQSIFRGNGLLLDRVQIIQPFLRTYEEKSLTWLGGSEVMLLLIEKGWWKEADIKKVTENLEKIGHDERIVIGFISYLQVLATKN